MNVICNKAKLIDAISKVAGAVSQKSTLPVLEGLLLKADQTTLTLSAYDLELGITTTVEAAAISEPGEIVLSCKLFADMVRKMPSEDIYISSDEKLLTTVKCKAVEYTILGLPAEDFPELPTVFGEQTLDMPSATLKSMVEMTRFAIASSDAKPVHTGSMFEICEDMVSVVSVDGYRLAIRNENIATGKQMAFIVPGKTLTEVTKLLKEDDVPVKILISQKHCMFLLEECTVVTRLLEGEFLDYKAAVPKGNAFEVVAETKNLIDAVERTSLLISDRLKSPLRINFLKESIKISCSTALGKAQDEIAAQNSGDDLEMGFNSKYLLDALKSAGTEKVKLEISGPVSPMKITPLDGNSFLFLVLPVRLKSE